MADIVTAVVEIGLGRKGTARLGLNHSGVKSAGLVLHRGRERREVRRRSWDGRGTTPWICRSGLGDEVQVAEKGLFLDELGETRVGRE